MLPVAVYQHHGYGPDLLEGEVGGHELAPVGKLHEHTVFRLDAQSKKADCRALRLVASLLKGEAALQIYEGYLVGMDVRGPVQPLRQGKASPPSALVVVGGILLPVGCRTFQHLDHLPTPLDQTA